MTTNSMDSRIRALVVELAETSPPAPRFDELTTRGTTNADNARLDNHGVQPGERELARQRRRRRRVIAGAVALATLLAATAGLIRLTTNTGVGRSVIAGGRTTPHTASGEPTSILAHTVITSPRGIDTSELVEVAASDGHVVRTLANVPSGITMYGITADRASVYLDGFDETGGVPCPGQNKSRVSILRVPLRGGQPVLESTGARPMLSADTRRLAYIRSDCGTPSQSFVPEHLAVRQLGSGTEQVWSLPPPYSDGNTGGFENIGPPEWAADGTHLLLRVVSGGQPGAPATGPTTWWWVDTRAPSGPIHAVRLRIPGGPRSPLDIIPLGGTGRWAALLLAPGPPGNALRVVNYDPARAAIGAELTRFQPPANATVRLIDADASGRHVLLTVTTGGSEAQPRVTDLYRWSPGQKQPVAVAHNVVAATW